jgi:hypothetical protein
MERRTLTIILGMALLLLGIPLFFMWSVISRGTDDKYWEVNNAELIIVTKDSLSTEHYHIADAKSGIDTSDQTSALVYFDVDFYDEPKSNNSMLSAAQKPGYMGNPQKINALNIFLSDYYKTSYQDVTRYFANDSTANYNEVNSSDFLLYKKYHGAIDYHKQRAYVTNSFNHLIYLFNQDNSRFDDIGDDNYFLKFKIDKALFRQTNRLFKLKLKVSFSDKNFERTIFCRLK